MKRDEVIGIEDVTAIVPRPSLKMRKPEESVDVNASMMKMSMMPIEILTLLAKRGKCTMMISRDPDPNHLLSPDDQAIEADAIVIESARRTEIETETETTNHPPTNIAPRIGPIETGVEAASVIETETEIVNAAIAIVTIPSHPKTRNPNLDPQQ